jgi:hypothetical protein
MSRKNVFKISWNPSLPGVLAENDAAPLVEHPENGGRELGGTVHLHRHDGLQDGPLTVLTAFLEYRTDHFIFNTCY